MEFPQEKREEMKETLGQVRMVRLFLENYRKISAGTGDELLVRQASDRVEGRADRVSATGDG